MIEKFNVISLIVKSALSFFALFIISLIIHECAHMVFAVVLNVPIESFTWFNWDYWAPVLILGSTEKTLALTAIGYAGGLISGGLFLTIVILCREWLKRSLYRWILGCCLVTLGLWELSMGILEGAFHNMYATDVINGSGVSYGIIYISAICGIALYCISMPRPQQSKRRKRGVAPVTRFTHPSPSPKTG